MHAPTAAGDTRASAVPGGTRKLAWTRHGDLPRQDAYLASCYSHVLDGHAAAAACRRHAALRMRAINGKARAPAAIEVRARAALRHGTATGHVLGHRARLRAALTHSQLLPFPIAPS